MPPEVRESSLLRAPDNVGGAIRTVFNIIDEWELTADEGQALLGLPRRTYFRWKKSAPDTIDPTTLERISYVFRIYRALRTLFPLNHHTWVRLPNTAPLFGGDPPVRRMTSGLVADLFLVQELVVGWSSGN